MYQEPFAQESMTQSEWFGLPWLPLQLLSCYHYSIFVLPWQCQLIYIHAYVYHKAILYYIIEFLIYFGFVFIWYIKGI